MNSCPLIVAQIELVQRYTEILFWTQTVVMFHPSRKMGEKRAGAPNVYQLCRFTSALCTPLGIFVIKLLREDLRSDFIIDEYFGAYGCGYLQQCEVFTRLKLNFRLHS